MPSTSLNAITAPDNYTVAATIEGLPLQRINIDVLNQAIFWQLKYAIGSGVGGTWDTAEVFMSPGSRSLIGRGAVGIRIRAATKLASLPAGSIQAVVTIEGVTT